MTREDFYLVHYDGCLVNPIVDKIYDDFESRTCNNCKSKHCDIKIALIKSDSINPDYFCCNDWEQK